MEYIPELRFKEIADDTSEKERERKLLDQRRWKQHFDVIILDYFQGKIFNSLHTEFNEGRDRLDCFVPASGEFICGGRKPGKRKGKKKKKPATEEEKLAAAKTQQETQTGCGRNWNSNRTLTKFVCTIDNNKLFVDLRELGQRCDHCTKRFENPSFADSVLQTMITWVLQMILEGIFNVVDNNIVVHHDDLKLHGNRHRPTATKSKSSHLSSNCEACEKDKKCGVHRSNRKRRKRRNRANVVTSSNALSS